jgi:hypothetical protein
MPVSSSEMDHWCGLWVNDPDENFLDGVKNEKLERVPALLF